MLPVHGSEQSVEAGSHPFVTQFPNVSDMMHLDLFFCFPADATGFSQFGAGSEADQGTYDIDVVVPSGLKSESAFSPILINIKADVAIRFSPSAFDKHGQVLSEALKNLWDGELVFLRERQGPREFQDILDTGELFPVVHKAVVVLKTTVHATVELNDLVRVQGSPGSFCSRFSCPCAEASLLEPFEQFFQGGFHDGCPSRTSTLDRFPLPGLLLNNFGLPSVADGQDGSQEECLFGSCIRDACLLFAEGQLEMVLEKGFHLLLDLFGCGVTSAQPDEPIVGVSQVMPTGCATRFNSSVIGLESIFHGSPVLIRQRYF